MDQVRRLDERAHQSIVYYEEDDWLQDRSEPGPEKELVIRDAVDPGVVADDGDLEEGGHIEGAHTQAEAEGQGLQSYRWGWRDDLDKEEDCIVVEGTTDAPSGNAKNKREEGEVGASEE